MRCQQAALENRLDAVFSQQHEAAESGLSKSWGEAIRAPARQAREGDGRRSGLGAERRLGAGAGLLLFGLELVAWGDSGRVGGEIGRAHV